MNTLELMSKVSCSLIEKGEKFINKNGDIIEFDGCFFVNHSNIKINDFTEWNVYIDGE